MITVTFDLELVDVSAGDNELNNLRHLVSLTRDMASVPRVGDQVYITSGDWSERAETVWHNPHDGSVVVEFRERKYDPQYEDLFQIATEAGWVPFARTHGGTPADKREI